MSADDAGTRARGLVLLGLLFASGFAALVYQVLWARQLALLLGSTAQAAALTVAIFFLGLAWGGLFWGRRAGRLPRALAGFGWLEIAVGLTALGHFVLIDVYAAIYPRLYVLVGADPALDLLAKVLVATLLLLPPSFLMGGTLPMVVQHVVRVRERLGVLGSRLYAVNTAGSATGALAAGFVLPLALGFDRAYLLAVGIDVTVGIAAVLLARRVAAHPGVAHAGPLDTARRERGAGRRQRARRARMPGAIVAVAFVSGFATLAVEIVWTRMFSQVLQNSAYTYALVLATFLAALALGAAVANLLCRLRRPAPEWVLGILLLASAAVTASSPWLFHRATDGLAYVGADLGWNAYLGAVAVLAVVVMLGPGTVLGTTLPYLLRTLQRTADAPGTTVGRLVAVNTTGAVVGSLVAGFVLLPLVGAWSALVLVAASYVLLLAALCLAPLLRRATTPQRSAHPSTRPAMAGLLVAALAFGSLAAAPRDFATVSVRDHLGERVLEVTEGAQASVAVVENQRGSRAIRVDNYYTLGSSGARHPERDQTLVPLLAHPDVRSVFFLGMGTGITAGAALHDERVERVVVCELLADVVDAAGRHFRRWTNGLFHDPRVEIHAEDGRNCLRRSPERFDLIISDLFTPWQAGTGNLYTAEHYATARTRLEPGGAYVQWLPLYQVSEVEFASIARTMDDVFDQVVAWRGDFFTDRSVVALVGHTDDAPLDLSAAVAAAERLVPDVGHEELEALVLRLYAGNVGEGGLFAAAPRNTDANPVIEYTAPRTHREARIGRTSFLVGEHRERLYHALLEAAPPTHDPYLRGIEPARRDHVLAGSAWSTLRWAEEHGRRIEARQARDRLASLPGGLAEPTTPSRLLSD